MRRKVLKMSTSNKKQKIVTIIVITALILIGFGLLWGIYFFGLVGLFNLLGIHYDSFYSLALFVINIFLVGIFIELFFKMVYLFSLPFIRTKHFQFLFRLSIESIANWFTFYIVDSYMQSIFLSLQMEWSLALLLALLEIMFDDDQKKTK
jgi:hypothetical protein